MTTRPVGPDLPSPGNAGLLRPERWLRRPEGGALPWPQVASLGLHGLALAAALGLLALPRLTPPPADEAVEMLWEQQPALESAAMPEAEPASPPPEPPPPEAMAQPPEALPQPIPPPVSTALPLPQPSPPPLYLEPPPPATPESTALLPPPPQQTAEAPPELPLPPPPAPPSPRQQPARPPAPQPAERRQTPANSAVAVSPTPSAEGSARVVGATTAPQTDYRPPQPSYPENARMRGETGTVRLRIQVDVSGQVSRVDILETSGSRDLDRATEAHYRRWRFRPAMREGQPIAGEVTTNMTWTLSGLAANRPW